MFLHKCSVLKLYLSRTSNPFFRHGRSEFCISHAERKTHIKTYGNWDKIQIQIQSAVIKTSLSYKIMVMVSHFTVGDHKLSCTMYTYFKI
jgi:hypothetical protein